MKKTLSILALIVVAFAFSACTQEETVVNEEETEVVTTDEVSVQEEIVDTEEELPSGVSVEIDVDDELSIADKIKDDEKKSIKDCDALTDESLKEGCVADVYTFMALEERDESICDKITAKKDQDSCKGRLEHAATFNQVESIEDIE